MILVDSSALVNYLRESSTPGAGRLNQVIERGIAFGICLPVYFEVLQGAVSGSELELLHEYLGSLPFYEPRSGLESYAAAARMSFEMRRKGLTIPGISDCLIAVTAMENDLFVLHDDAHFDRIAKMYPLKVWEG